MRKKGKKQKKKLNPSRLRRDKKAGGSTPRKREKARTCPQWCKRGGGGGCRSTRGGEQAKGSPSLKGDTGNLTHEAWATKTTASRRSAESDPEVVEKP